MKKNERAWMRDSLRIDKIAKQILESMHPVEEGDVGTARQEIFEIMRGKKLV
jgi:hypothetical protein